VAVEPVDCELSVFAYLDDVSLQSMDKIAAVTAKEHAQLWINHDHLQSDAQKKLPAYYE
jgi:hypothetical protein